MYLKIAKKLSEQYISNPEYNATEDLVKIAQDNKLNAHEIERIVNRANREIIVGLQKEAVLGNQDPHFTFPTIKTAEIIGMIQPTASRAQARRPSVEKKTVAHTKSAALKYDLSEYELEDINNAGLASQVLDVWKTKERAFVSKVAQLEFKIDNLKQHFDKLAAQELLRGTPVGAIDALGIDTGVIEKLSSWGHKLNTIEEEIEIVDEHQLAKIASAILTTKEQLVEASAELEQSRVKTASLSKHMRGLL